MLSGARTLVRETDEGLRASIYYPDRLIRVLEQHPPQHGLCDANVDAFATLVEELDHFLMIVARARSGRPLTLFELELHANVSKHLVLSRFLAGAEVVEVFAKGSILIDPGIGEAGDIDSAVTVLTFANDATAVIDNSRKAVYGYDQRVEAFGSGGMASSQNFHDFNATIATDQGVRRPPLQHFFLERYTTSYLDQWAAFVAAVRDGTPPPVTGADGRAPLVIGLAAKKSMDEGRPVHVEEVDP